MSVALAHDIVNRWSATQVNGGGLQRGDPVTLRWSVVPDGQSYSRSSNSNLIQFLDDGWNVPAAQRGFDYTNRPWWTVMNNAYAQYGRVAGFTMVYVPELNANGTDTGMEGDIRIGGENLDGTPGGALADNTFPNDGDMRIDTTRELDGSIGFYFSTEPGLRNLIIHESGHGVGLGHVEFVGGSGKAVMEGGLRTDIWGFQFDDIYGLNRQYGDPREKNGGNNSAATANLLGNFSTTGSVSWGGDAVDGTIEQFDDDFLGIDGSNDTDWFRFSITGETFANIQVTPVGPTYTTVQQGLFNASAQNDLSFQFLYENPGGNLSLISNVNQHGLGGSELVPAGLLTTAGNYLLRVRGPQDANQFYQLDLTLSELPQPGMSADLDFNGLTDIADWQTFITNAYTDLSGLSDRDAFQLGDLDLDGDNDFDDFRYFKSAYDLVNGIGAFAAIGQVPEPQPLMLLGVLVLIGGTIRQRML
ncbi:MAG: hypothetical protein IT427_03755, partial [Pirellulales bacterium]|nr:hypothetical protein [Pirellulales bacterium]